jgi:phenylpropionate dioxygenase-like ring-hydroxylating dioxygenase large terminal subunit
VQSAPLTARYPFLGTGPVSTEPYISPDYFERERENLFKRVWLNVCREIDIPEPGDFVVRELEIAKTSLIVVHGRDGKIRAFHNICSHRGNRLVNQERGSCNTFVCGYHGWSYGLDGAVSVITAEDAFFDLNRAACALPAVACEVWRGFVFINLAPQPEQSLREYLGGYADFAEGYPFERLNTPARLSYDLEANWKLGVDAFTETYHAMFLHVKTQRNMYYTAQDRRGSFLSLDLFGPHRRYSIWANTDFKWPQDFHVERLVLGLTRNVNAGLADEMTETPILELCPGLNPTRAKNWAWDQTFIFPNTVVTMSPHVMVLNQFWPVAFDRCRWECTTWLPPIRSASERFARAHGFSHMRDVAAEDVSTMSGTAKALAAGIKKEFYLQDFEISIRHMLHSVNRYVAGAVRAAAE